MLVVSSTDGSGGDEDADVDDTDDTDDTDDEEDEEDDVTAGGDDEPGVDVTTSVLMVVLVSSSLQSPSS